MLKYLIICFCIVVQLKAIAQIVIKEEIKLGDNIDDLTFLFTKPGYRGKIFYDINGPGLGLLKGPGFHIYVGDWNVIYVQNDCLGWGSFSDSIIVNGTTLPPLPITTELYNCNYDGTAYPVPLNFEQIFDNNRVKYNIINGETGTSIGPVWYEPDACGNIVLCSEPFSTPGLNIYRITNPDACNDPNLTADPAGVFRGLYWELREGEEFTLTPCQNQMSGEIKFKYSTNQSQTIDCPYNLELCPDIVNNLWSNVTRLDDLPSFEDYLDSITTPEQACTLRSLIRRQAGIDANGIQTGTQGFIDNGIWLTDITEAHEEEHRCDYENELNLAKTDFDKKSYSAPCSTYQADPEQAMVYAVTWHRVELTKFSMEAKNKYDSKVDELALNGRDSIQDKIIPYLNALDNYAKSNPLIKNRYKDIIDNCN